MKFRISKQVLLDGLNKVSNIVSTRATLPILSNVLIVAKNGRLFFTTTDLDMGITGSIPAEISQEGATTLPAKRLTSIISALPASEVEISVDERKHASIRSGPSFFKIIGLSETEFPPLPDFEDAKEFTISQSDLREGLNKTSYAISADETRYVLNGIYASFRDQKITLVATDGRRLAMIDYPLSFDFENEVDVIIPSKTVQELKRLLGDSGEALIKISGSQISFRIGDSLLVSKLIDGNYPNYRQVIPSQTGTRVTIPREAFQDTVNRVAILSPDKANSIKLVFTDNRIEVSANAQDIGEAQETLDVIYQGPTMQIAFNPDFLKTPLKNLDVNDIYLDLIDEMSPGVIRTDSSFLYVLMPMRVTN